MNDWPQELVVRSTPFPSRPERPAVGCFVQVMYYNVECRLVGGRETFYVWNTMPKPEVLSMGYDWDRMCHQLGWFPLEGLAHREKLPSELPAAPSKDERAAAPAKAAASPAKSKRARASSPATSTSTISSTEVAEGPPVDPRQTSLF